MTLRRRHCRHWQDEPSYPVPNVVRLPDVVDFLPQTQ